MKLDSFNKIQIERLKYIEFKVMFLGEIKRSDIMDYFGIASAAATRDLSLYKEVSNNNIELNQKSKIYHPKDTFKAIFEHSIDHTFNALSSGYSESTVARLPLITCDYPQILSKPKLETLSIVSRAIYQKKTINITYHSFSSGSTTRLIAPFALINNGHRWHARAYDKKRNDFRDFVLTRIEHATIVKDSVLFDYEQPEHDSFWSRIVELELVAHPKRSESDKKIINMDYEMHDGVLRVKVRAALVGYLLRQWSIDCSSDQSLTDKEYRLWLRNHPILYSIENAKLAPGYQTNVIQPCHE